MNHEKIALKLSAFTDNELSDTVKDEISEHLKTCQKCASEVEKMVSQRVYLQQALDTLPSSDFRARLTEKLENKKTEKLGFNIGKLLPIPLVLSLLIVVFTAYMVSAPLIYGMNDATLKNSPADMTKNAVASSYTGGIFAPAAFMKLCGTCTMNAGTCCKAKCGNKCKMGGNKDGK
jgi:hypothetical protein